MKVPVPVNGSRICTPLLPKRLAELGLQHLVHGMDDEVHHLDRRIDDAQPLGHLREGIAEKLVVKLDNDFLLGIGLVDASGAALHALVELLEAFRFFLKAMFVQCTPAPSAWLLIRGCSGRSCNRRTGLQRLAA
jgi:hypothetical protein